MWLINSSNDAKFLTYAALISFAPIYLPPLFHGTSGGLDIFWSEKILWAEGSNEKAVIFTGISAIIGALIAFSGVFIPQIAGYVRSRTRLRRKWQGQLRSVIHFIHLSLEQLSASGKTIMKHKIKDVHLLRNALTLKGEKNSPCVNCSAMNAPYPFNAEDLANMSDDVMNAYFDYEYQVNMLSLKYKYIEDMTITSTPGTNLDDKLIEDLLENIMRVLNKGKLFNQLADPTYCKKIYG